jgi:manganese transport protein
MIRFIKRFFDKKGHLPNFRGLEVLKYIGPGLLVTIGFIDPGNWASDMAAGSMFGYQLLWVISLSTIMLIILQHNVAHLGIATGLCLSEAANIYLKKWASKPLLSTAIAASVSTALAEIMGGAIALNMLFSIPVKIGAIIICASVWVMLLSNSYSRIEKWIIGFLAVVGLSFFYELFLVDVSWPEALQGWVVPSFPHNSMIIIMSVLGAVVMPHNLFLHSEIIQSRQWNLKEENVIRKQLDYEFTDTLLSMIVGWAINSAILLLAASAFYHNGIVVNELQQAKDMLTPLLGNSAGVIFAIALLFAGIASTITAAISGGSIFAGLYSEPYDIKDNHSRFGIGLTLLPALLIIFFINNPFQALIISQMILSIQLPFTVFLQLYLTSSKKVMGKYANKRSTIISIGIIATIITVLNIILFIGLF